MQTTNGMEHYKPWQVEGLQSKFEKKKRIELKCKKKNNITDVCPLKFRVFF